jgi:hypothetical protein
LIYGAHAVCFCPLVVILDPSFFFLMNLSTDYLCLLVFVLWNWAPPSEVHVNLQLSLLFMCFWESRPPPYTC